MTYDEADDFDHPLLPPGHALQPHVLYRVRVRPVSWFPQSATCKAAAGRGRSVSLVSSRGRISDRRSTDCSPADLLEALLSESGIRA
jgi:hypothetical protein